MASVSRAVFREQAERLIEHETRLMKLEEWATRTSPGLAVIGGVIGRGFFGRLRWLLFGK